MTSARVFSLRLYHTASACVGQPHMMLYHIVGACALSATHKVLPQSGFLCPVSHTVMREKNLHTPQQELLSYSVVLITDVKCIFVLRWASPNVWMPTACCGAFISHGLRSRRKNHSYLRKKSLDGL